MRGKMSDALNTERVCRNKVEGILNHVSKPEKTFARVVLCFSKRAQGFHLSRFLLKPQ